MAPPKIEAVETVPDVATFRYTNVYRPECQKKSRSHELRR
jgi:hypothetical protein